MYARYFKRMIDFTLSLCALIVLSPVFVILIILGAINMKGNPFFTQLRPGKDEKIFKLIKFRTMSCEKDKDGNLLPDELRLNKYGKMLRASSLDELPELVNILKGDMAIVGPRPQLVKDMVFMNSTQRKRHSVTQGLTGLAQVNGRNAISWEDKINYDLEYISNITFVGDVKILVKTVVNVFKRDGISAEGMETAEDYGDYLLNTGKINQKVYKSRVKKARRIVRKAGV